MPFRGGNGWGPAKFGFEDYAAWAKLFEHAPTRWDVIALNKMDTAWLVAWNEHQKTAPDGMRTTVSADDGAGVANFMRGQGAPKKPPES